jgi:hypothetical protein
MAKTSKGTASSKGGALKNLKNKILEERLKVTLSANASMISLYWEIGNEILQRQQKESWGAKIIDRLSLDLKNHFQKCQVFLPEISNTCGNLQKLIKIKQLCNAPLHKYHGEQILLFWTN